MAGLKYGYTPRRRRTPKRRLWLALPIAFVAGAVLLGLWLSADGGEPAAGGESVLTGGPLGQAPAPHPSRQPLDTSDPPVLTGKAAAIIEEPCGALTYELNAHQRLPPASLTKIATALVAAERADLSEVVTVQVNGPELSAQTDATVMGIKPGDRLSVSDLIYGLLLPSGNDAAIAIAEHVAGTVPDFVQLMNQEAARLGLSDTHFSNPHGLDDPDLYTSAFDIAVLGGELLQRPELAEVVSTPLYQPAWDGPALRNLNLLLGNYPGALGVKTGYTDQAGQTIVGAAERDGRRLIVSVLGSSDIYVDTMALFEWAFAATPQECGTAGNASPLPDG